MKRSSKIVIFTFLTILGLYIVFMLVYFPTSEPKFCSNCHYIDPYLTSWENKPHKNVKCLFCHENRGFLGKIESKARGLNNVYLDMTNQETTIFVESEVFQQNCVACHTGATKKYPEAPRLDQEHFNFLKQNKSCLDCHHDPGHDLGLFDIKK